MTGGRVFFSIVAVFEQYTTYTSHIYIYSHTNTLAHISADSVSLWASEGKSSIINTKPTHPYRFLTHRRSFFTHSRFLSLSLCLVVLVYEFALFLCFLFVVCWVEWIGLVWIILLWRRSGRQSPHNKQASAGVFPVPSVVAEPCVNNIKATFFTLR